jgi:hypothetical protein
LPKKLLRRLLVGRLASSNCSTVRFRRTAVCAWNDVLCHFGWHDSLSYYCTVLVPVGTVCLYQAEGREWFLEVVTLLCSSRELLHHLTSLVQDLTKSPRSNSFVYRYLSNYRYYEAAFAANNN